MTLLIDGNPEELAQFLGLLVNDDDDTDNDTNERFVEEFAELMKRYPDMKDFKIIGTKVDDADGEKS